VSCCAECELNSCSGGLEGTGEANDVRPTM
jgi:hypothetical protein